MPKRCQENPPLTVNRGFMTALRGALNDPQITIEQTARCLGVTPAIFYRHLPGGRSAIQES